MSALSDHDLTTLEQRVRLALETGDESTLEVLGYGEISTVVAWRGDRAHACKRLPPFPDEGTYLAYAEHLSRYLARLRDAGVAVVESTLQTLSNADGTCAVWCVQPLLPGESFLPALLRGAVEDADGGAVIDEVLDALIERVLGAVGPTLGVDGQASNWVWLSDEPTYLDVTTPMMRDASGNELLDTELFLASLPWALRGTVRRFMLGDILDKYYDPRGVLLDLAGNLLKEGLAAVVPRLLERSNTHLTAPIHEDEVKRYYQSDAKMWALLQRLRRMDRWWQRAIRRRTYPFLLPGRIERRV